jgi:hypothetical protein
MAFLLFGELAKGKLGSRTKKQGLTGMLVLLSALVRLGSRARIEHVSESVRDMRTSPLDDSMMSDRT